MPNSTLSEILEQYQALAGKITPEIGKELVASKPFSDSCVSCGTSLTVDGFDAAQFVYLAANHFPTLVAELEKLQADKWADLRREHESARKLGAERQQVDELRAALARNQEALRESAETFAMLAAELPLEDLPKTVKVCRDAQAKCEAALSPSVPAAKENKKVGE